MNGRMLFAVMIPLLLLVHPESGYGQAPGTPRGAEAPAKVTPPAGVKFDPAGRRDPFLNPLLLKRKVDEQNQEISRGEPPPGIAGMYIEQVTLLGTSLNEGKFTAVFRGTDKRAYFLHEGDRLFDGYIQRINGDSVVLVRETTLRSGKTLTQEVTKRLRLP